jgi:HD-like signal output (HDOD) protein
VLADGLVLATGAKFPQAYAAGLVHDIGRLALAVRTTATAAQPLAEAHCRAGAQPGGEMQWERDFYGADHCQLGGRLLAEWRLPEELVQVAARHHQDGWKWAKDLLSHVRLACAVASHLGFAAAPRRDDFERTLALVPNELRSRLPANPAAMAAALRIRLELTEDGDAEKLAGASLS